MDVAGRDAAKRPQERSSHTAFIDNNTLYVWGGYRVVDGDDVLLPSDEIWLCDLDSGAWELRQATGDVPTGMAVCCGANVGSTLYIFGGWMDAVGLTNQVYSAELSQQHCSWRKVTDVKGETPSPRNKHSCWVHGKRLIYFGGYGCKTVADARASSSSFVVDEMSWSTIGTTLFRYWGWNSEVVVFDLQTATWSKPATRGSAPSPRGCHASALLGNRGYVSGGTEVAELDVFCLDLETWTWSEIVASSSRVPPGRSMHSMTPVSDHALFVFGGLSAEGSTLSDAWSFDTRTSKWTEVEHRHRDALRVCHSACPGNDGDVVVFGGCSDLCITMDSVSILTAQSHHHCSDLLVFQTQPHSLSRLCEGSIGRHWQQLAGRLHLLPPKLRRKAEKRAAAAAASAPGVPGRDAAAARQ